MAAVDHLRDEWHAPLAPRDVCDLLAEPAPYPGRVWVPTDLIAWIVQWRPG
jgi:hypothetical protein